MRIAMIASESNPLCKTGGLADVVYSLSKQLAEDGEDVIVVLPFYSSIRDKGIRASYVGSYPVSLSWRHQNCDVYHCREGGVEFYLLDNHYYFGRSSLYGYLDDGERFAFFATAARGLFGYIGYQPDVIHCHDWQTGMIPCLVREQNAFDPTFSHTKFVFTIHNPAFKGIIDRYFLNDFYELSDELYFNGKVRFEGMVSTLKTGIVYSDYVTTVSPTHAKELLTEEGGFGLNGVLSDKGDRFLGIANGIDYGEWDPLHDKLIYANYSSSNVTSGKQKCRKRLFDVAGFEDNGGPVYGLVSRLTYQKGIDLVLSVGREICARGGYIFVLGSGEYRLEQGLEQLRREYPNNVCIYIGYSGERAHLIYSGADFFLMPSLFEPCGIGQMIAERYGTLPVARAVGGLSDTIDDGKTGFLFKDYDDGGLRYGVMKAEEAYLDKKRLLCLRRAAMKQDHSWKKAAAMYQKIYR